MKSMISAMLITLSVSAPAAIAADNGGMMNMQKRMQDMDHTMEQARNAKNESHRHDMMEKHMEQMRETMKEMHQMSGGRGSMMENMGGGMGMMGGSKQGGGMMDGSGKSGGMMGGQKGMHDDGMKGKSDSRMSDGMMSEKVQHMDRRMDMMQMMMDQMMEHQQAHERMYDQ